MYTSTFLLALGLASQGAIATGSWGGAKPFSCPGNTPTTCSSEQSSGFTWGSAQVGQSVTSYGGCGFSGVTCQAQGPGGKLHKRTGGISDKCVSGKISGQQHECPSMSAGHDSSTGSNMSPSSYHVSCSYDTQVDFTYEMPDGSTCKHTSPCSAGGNDVQNTQCGGAKSVTCSQSSGEKSKNSGKDCSMGIHSVGFQCGPATSIVPPKSSSTPASKPATSVETHPATTPESKPATTPATTPASKPATSVESKPASSVPASSKPATTESKPATTEGPKTTPVPGSTTPVASSKPASSGPPYAPPSNSTSKVETTAVRTTPVASSVPATTEAKQSSFATTTFMTTSVVFQTTEITVTSCAPEITNCPAESKTPMVITKTVSQFTTVCPVTATMVPSGNSMVPVISSTPVATSKAAESSAPAAQPSSPSTPGTNCPDLVPSCINTLLMSVQTTCQDNSDSSCFCAIANHTQFIQDCIAAHGADAAEIQTALTYMQGLCAPQIPQNPTIVTHQPNGQPQQPACPSGVPATTITVQVTQTPTATGAAVTPVVIQSTVTLPQVQVTVPPTTPGAATTPAAALVPGYGATTAPAATQGPPNSTPAAVSMPAATTPAAAKTSVIPGAPVYGGMPAASTGGVTKPTGPVSPPIATGAAGKFGVSFGAVAVAAALLI